MTNLSKIMSLALAVLSACQDPKIEHLDQAPPTLKSGMTLSEVHKLLLANGARFGEDYYHRPGNKTRSQFYELIDQTCVEIRTEAKGKIDEILWFAHGSRTTIYPGKIEWLEMKQEGIVQEYSELKLP